MKRNLMVLFIIFCVASTSTAFARGYYRGNHGGYNSGYNSGSHRGSHRGYHNRYHSRSYSHGYRGRSHHDDLGVAVAALGGLFLVSALVNSARPYPPRVGYGSPYPAYPPSRVQQPRICFETRKVSGEWQINMYDGRYVWVQFAYPLPRNIQVPCY